MMKLKIRHFTDARNICYTKKRPGLRDAKNSAPNTPPHQRSPNTQSDPTTNRELNTNR